MPEVGVRELKTSASEIVRAVREQRARYLITYRGRAVGVLLPLEEAGTPGPQSGETAWEELNRLGEQIAQGWQSPQTSTEIISEMRR